MENYKSKIIKEIAQELDCGNECYYDPKTEEIIAIPNFTNISDEEEFRELYKDALKTVKKNKKNLIKIDILENFESFKIMERFIDQITEPAYKLELENILQNNKPFQHFKYSIDHSTYRQEWFDFKHAELERIVENQLISGSSNAKHSL